MDAIADALIAARTRGVQIRILANRSNIFRLEAAKFQLKRTKGGGGGIMHNKFAVFDGAVPLTGSYNWSANAENNNDENAIFVRDPEVVTAYQTAFN